MSVHLPECLSVHPSVSLVILTLPLTSTYINWKLFFFFIPTVIRAKISGEKIVSPSNNSSPYMKMIQYEIKMIKVRCLKKLKCQKHICGSSLIIICLLVHDLSRCSIFFF